MVQLVDSDLLLRLNKADKMFQKQDGKGRAEKIKKEKNERDVEDHCENGCKNGKRKYERN